ncbi:TolC family protein [Phenylobacterium sp. Root700]|uniref:TolC family protein n=1 Tax=Phenylobacterium sp. Root700 TaxID=1736591 RepID=UPI0006FDBCB2|nr:TolC family protein [Phenylobacterium sp. Root700]KRB44482.1 transporter [Phenylobacterium sp. Root700]
MTSPYRRWPLCAVMAGVALSAGAASADPAPPYPELLRQAQTTSPRLAEARAEIARATGLAHQAGARPNPILGVEIENFSGSGPYKGSSLAETTASLEQTLELGGKRGARVEAGRAEVEAARRRAAEAGAAFAYDLAAAYAGAEAAERRVEFTTEAVALAEEDARVASALVEAGREADLRRVQAMAAVQAARAGLDEARAARATAFGALTVLAGAPTPLSSISTSLLAQADRKLTISPLDPLASPGYLAAQAEREAAARRIRVERTRATPDLSISLGVRRFQEDDTTAMVAGVSAPFPLFDRNRGNIGAAQAELSAAEARLEAARLDAEAGARAGVARVAATDSRLVAAREGERTAEEAYRLTRIGYEGGKLALVELLGARRALADARAQTLDAALERLSAQAVLARLQGRAPFGEQP